MEIDKQKLEEEQKELAEKVVLEDGFDSIERVAGVDQGFKDGHIISSIVVWDLESKEVVETKCHVGEEEFPYIPGLLSYREAPSIIEAFEKLESNPDILLVDGNGYLHFRRLGLASHVGVELDFPTVGIAKSLLTGEVQEFKEGKAEVIDDGEMIGYCVHTKEKCNPVYVSPGHKVGFDSSVGIVRECLDGHKLPEPVFLADKQADKDKNSRF